MPQASGRKGTAIKRIVKITKSAAILLALVVLGAWPAQAAVFGTKFTSEGLGLGSSDLNGKGVLSSDQTGFVTSDTTGEGSILTIQTDGLAGTSTPFVTVTAQTHLDTVIYPKSWGGDPRDYQAGVLFISNENTESPDGKKEGLGVTAFKVDADGYRTTERGKQLEGSKHVSGGTGPDTFDPYIPNGAPHVDEAVNFNFDSAWLVDAQSVEVLLSDYELKFSKKKGKKKDKNNGEFEKAELIDLTINGTLYAGLGPDPVLDDSSRDESIFEKVGGLEDKLWKLKFSGLGLASGTFTNQFTIRATEPDPWHGGTAEHFFITGMNAEFVSVAPVPGAVLLGVIGVGFSCWLGRRKFGA